MKNKKLHWAPSLKLRLVLFVFFSMIAASTATFAAYYLLYAFGLLASPFRTGPFGPLYSLFVSSVVGTSIAAMISQRYLRPMNDLIQATRMVSKGDFTVRLQERESYGEMNELIQSFNRMTADLGGIEIFRSDFINNFSHEFKTPIVSIRGFARQLLRDDLSAEQRREYANTIVEQSERLANMAQNILLLSKLESQHILSDHEPFRVDEQVRTSLLMFEKQWTQKNLELSLEMEETVCDGNAELLSHVWQNIFSNAMKFSPQDGELTVVCRTEGRYARVSIGNQGPGMNAETKSHIFEKFYQGDYSHNGEGNGLGLPLAKRIVELSGGKIQVDSTPDTGAVFTVFLPVKIET